MHLPHAICIAVLCCVQAVSAATTTVMDVATQGSTIRVAHYRPDSPVANLIMIVGGVGVLNLQTDGLGTDPFFAVNVLSRDRDRFVAAGYSVFLVDVRRDKLPAGIPLDYRSTPEHMAELHAVLQWVKTRDNLPTWVVGNSLGGVSASRFAVTEPTSESFGLILVSPYFAPILDFNLQSLQRPTLLLTHQFDTCIGIENAPVFMDRLTATVTKRHVQFSGGASGPSGCEPMGPHGLGGLDAEFVAEATRWMQLNVTFAMANAPGALSGLWWNSGESGWGIAFIQRRNVIFAAWYTYDSLGNPKWYVASSCAMPAAGVTSGTCNGTLYEVSGSTFFGATFNPAAVSVATAGSLSVNFAHANSASMTYTVGAQTRTVAITRQAISSGAVPGVDFSDLWWDPNESGWGMAIAQQGSVMFLAWYVYDSNGKPTWYVASDCTVSGNRCSGTLYRTMGPPFGQTFDPTRVQVLTAGTVTLTFTDAYTGTLSYTVNGVAGTKTIKRQLF